jgi:hypothetical protein
MTITYDIYSNLLFQLTFSLQNRIFPTRLLKQQKRQRQDGQQIHPPTLGQVICGFQCFVQPNDDYDFKGQLAQESRLCKGAVQTSNH